MQFNKKFHPDSISAKIKQIAKLLKAEIQSTPLKKNKVKAKAKKPHLSSTNAIERISKMIRQEIHSSLERKVSGE